jgi:hypothetical protein
MRGARREPLSHALNQLFSSTASASPSAAGPHEQRQCDCELPPSLALQHGLLHPAKAEHTGGEGKDSSKPQPGQPISYHHLIRKPPQVRHERLHRIALCRGDAVGDSHHSHSQPAHKPRPRMSSAINNRQTRRAVWNGIWRVHHSAHAVFDVMLVPVICCCIHWTVRGT